MSSNLAAPTNLSLKLTFPAREISAMLIVVVARRCSVETTSGRAGDCMTKIVGVADGTGNNINSAILTGIAGGTVLSESATKIVVDASGKTVTLTGTGFGGFNAQGVPSTGTVTGVSPGDTGHWSGFSISAVALWTIFQNGDVAGFNNALFGGNDTFISHDTGNTLDTNDNFTGFGGNDLFDMRGASLGAYATLLGDDGNDTFKFNANFDAATDTIDGGTGTDTLILNGAYAGLTFKATTMVNVEKVTLAAGHNYNITMNDANVAAGQTLTVRAQLGAGNSLVFNGAHETDGNFVIIGGNGNDTITGGLGGDHITPGAGADTLLYTAVAQSTGPNFDTLTGIDFAADHFDLNVAVSGIDAEVKGGSLSLASFNTDLNTAIGKTHLLAGHAVLFAPNAGDEAGKLFLIVDANGSAGYQANHDYVFELNGSVHLSSLSTADFI